MSPITPAVVTVILAAAYFGYRAINAHAGEADKKAAAAKHRKVLTEAKERAAGGDAAAMAAIGVSYCLGSGLKQSFREGYFWLLLAQQHGAEEAAGKPVGAVIEQAGRMIVEAERNEIEQRVAGWALGPGSTDTVALLKD